MRKLGFVLVLALFARAEDAVSRVHEVSDLQKDEAWWPVALAHARAAAGDAELRLERAGLVLRAPAAVHERVATALKEVRDGRGVTVVIELHFAKLKGDAGATSVPAEEIDAFLKERCDRIGGVTLACLNLGRATAEFTHETAYVSDFDVEIGMGGAAIGDVVIDTVKETWAAKLKPIVARKEVRVVAEFSISQIVRPIPDFQTLLTDVPVKIELPESRAQTVTRVVTCSPDAFAVIDLGDSTVGLLRASAAR